MYDDRLEVYERQIDCLRRGDRAEQLKLYAADLIYMFPFALDRPRKIVGLAQFRKVMEPLWRQAKAHGLKVTGYRGEVHLASDDPQLAFAESLSPSKNWPRLPKLNSFKNCESERGRSPS